MNAIQKDVEALTEKELTAANEKFPLFSSMHEGYAVILEELQEAAEELHYTENMLELIFKRIRDNQSGLAVRRAELLKQAAERGAAELIQVAAMAEKFIISVCEQAKQEKE